MPSGAGASQWRRRCHPSVRALSPAWQGTWLRAKVSAMPSPDVARAVEGRWGRSRSTLRSTRDPWFRASIFFRDFGGDGELEAVFGGDVNVAVGQHREPEAAAGVVVAPVERADDAACRCGTSTRRMCPPWPTSRSLNSGKNCPVIADQSPFRS